MFAVALLPQCSILCYEYKMCIKMIRFCSLFYCMMAVVIYQLIKLLILLVLLLVVLGTEIRGY